MENIRMRFDWEWIIRVNSSFVLTKREMKVRLIKRKCTKDRQ